MRKLLLLLSIVFFSIPVFAQQTVSGRVTDDKGVGIEGISVKEKGGAAGTSTDKNGYFSLKVKDSRNPSLVFSGVGFTEKEDTQNGSKSFDVTLVSNTVTLGGIEMVGTRSLKRSSTETPVPVDIIPISKLINQQGYVEINSILHYLAPSFNANRQSGSDGADHIDPATLRGLGPDQTLVLVNGKRWHQSSLVNIYGTRGRGNSGTDLNAIPAAAIDRIEILRDGASAQYGSDAIAGVVNIILKSSVNELTMSGSAGEHITGYGGSLKSGSDKIIENQSDGLQYNFNASYGFRLKDNGFFNITGDVLHKDKTFRPNNETVYPGSNYRQKFGDGSYTNFGVYFNNRINLGNNTEFYSFGGVNQRNGDAFAFTRDASSERNVVSIYPNGFNPQIQSNITDLSFAAGIRTKFGVWNADFSAITGSNRFQYEVDHTLNASLEAASPTHFDAGGFKLTQNTLNANFSRAFDKVASGLNLAMGTEVRFEQYSIFAGEVGSWKQFGPVVFAIDGTDTTFRPGGSQGFPGFQPKDIVQEDRTNVGMYVDAELDVTKAWMIAAAVRMEHYSDFGFSDNYKIASRVKVNDNVSLRGSWSTGFRAPSLPQIHFSSTYTNVVAGQIYENVIAPNSGVLAKLAGIPELVQETSDNVSAGFVAKIGKKINLTVDAYWVNVKNRIVLTGLFDNTDDKIGDILQSLNVGAAQFFTNAVDTKTSGIDVIATYNTALGKGRLNATMAANLNDMKIDAVKTTPLLAGKEDTYFGPRDKAFLLASAPDYKVGLSLDYSVNKFTVLLRNTLFSDIKLVNFADETDLYKKKLVTDIVFSIKASSKINISFGGNNILDVYPTYQDPGLTESGGMWDAVQMGFSGAFYFARIGLKLNMKK
jgi:iron complex outermembrane recepter protein